MLEFIFNFCFSQMQQAQLGLHYVITVLLSKFLVLLGAPVGT
jgi:hypothetical protein